MQILAGFLIFKEFSESLQEIFEQISSIDLVNYEWRHLTRHVLVAISNEKVVSITLPTKVKIILYFAFYLYIDVNVVVIFFQHAKELG